MLLHPFRSQARRVVFWAVFAALLLGSTSGYSFTALFAFGDSLTDTGRNPSGSGYFEGRFSNGPLWVEYLSAMLGIPYNASNNLAESGSTTSDLSSQIAGMPTATDLRSSLFTVWSGANDFLDGALSNGENDAAWAVTISNAVLNITNAVGTLYTKGGREVIVGNMPNLGQLPVASGEGAFTNYVDAKVQLFNTALAMAVTNLMQGCPGLRIYFMNANQELLTVFDSPATYGFTVTSVGALEDSNLSDKSFNGPGANYLFWDVIHPTTKMHALVGTLAYDMVGVGLNLARNGTNVNLTMSNLYPGFQYSIQGSTNLVMWTNVENFTAAGTNLNLQVTNAPGQGAFYRVGY